MRTKAVFVGAAALFLAALLAGFALHGGSLAAQAQGPPPALPRRPWRDRPLLFADFLWLPQRDSQYHLLPLSRPDSRPLSKPFVEQ